MNIRVFVGVWDAGKCLVPSASSLDASEDDADQNYEEDRAECSAQGNKDDYAEGVAMFCEKVSIFVMNS